MVTIHRQLKIGLYVEGVRNLQDLLPLWKRLPVSTSHASAQTSSPGLFVPFPKNIQHVQTVNYLSAAVVPMETICRAFVLRILVPDGFDVQQDSFLDADDFALRKSRIDGDAWTNFRKQMEYCALFCHGKRRPPVMLPYAPEMISFYAEKILSFVPRRVEDSLTLVSDTQTNEQIWVHIPINGVTGHAPNNQEEDTKDSDLNAEAFKAHKWWSSLKAAVNYSHHLGVVLEITEDLPSDLTLYDLWRSEPVRAIVIPTRLFVSLPDGSPSLSPFHALIVQSFILLWNVKVFLRPGGVLSVDDVKSLRPYTDYIRDLYHTSLVGKAEIPSPCLFPPAQPLRDHLTDSHYQEFELDVRKYADYETAVDRYTRYRQSFEDVPETFVVAVVGCGHGPLIDVTINAARNCGTITGGSCGTQAGNYGTVCTVTDGSTSFNDSSSLSTLRPALRIYAVEKNPAVLKALQQRCAKHVEDFQGEVEIQIVMEDMRTWEPPENFDILLSEMLGDFGDNELSPECLAGPEKFLNEHGVSIPRSYTSYLCPVSCGKLYELIPESGKKDRRLKERMYSFQVDYFKTLDEAKPVFAFEHPNSSGNCTNMKATLEFTAQTQGMLHGFSGHFSAQLYEDIEHCTVPKRRTPGLTTWNDVFFPLTYPKWLEKGDKVRLHVFRRKNKEAVWYEWALSEPCRSIVHNAGGRAFRMPLTFELDPDSNSSL